MINGGEYAPEPHHPEYFIDTEEQDMNVKRSARVPIGMFFCKGCRKNRFASEREGRYGVTCTHCKKPMEKVQ